jgi:4-hydroxy-tetrahydrodipicolinate synthase
VFAEVRAHLQAGNHAAAAASWQRVAGLTKLLFTEPSPAPAKYWLARTGLIASSEVRSPMVEVSAELAHWLDREIERWPEAASPARLVKIG